MPLNPFNFDTDSQHWRDWVWVKPKHNGNIRFALCFILFMGALIYVLAL